MDSGSANGLLELQGARWASISSGVPVLSFIHLAIFVEPLQWVRHYSRYWRSGGEENQHPCSCVA